MNTTLSHLRAALLLVALLVPGVVGAQDWSWAEGKTTQAVEWKGLKRLNQSEAASMISTKEGEAFSANTLGKDVARLYRSGRFGGAPDGQAPIRVSVVEADPGSVRVIFTVYERQKVRRDPLVYGGEGVLDSDTLEELLTTRGGSLYDPFAVERDARAIRGKLRDEGYLQAEVLHEVEAHESGMDVVFRIRPGPRVYVDEIIYDGAAQLDPSILQDAEGPDAPEVKERELFGLLEEGVYKPEALDRDMEKIARYYRSEGFLDVRVYKKAERYSLDGTALTLVLGIEEGARYTIRRVGVEGTKVIDGDRIVESLALKPGRPFLGRDLRKAIERIKHIYGRRAYVHTIVDVDVRYDVERHMLDVVLNVNEGPKVRIEQIKIEGNAKTQEKVIRRELSFYPGEYFDAQEVQDSIARLGRLRFFTDVRIDFQPGSEPGSEHVIVRVDEARTGSFVLGGGVSTSAGFFGNISLTQRNFDVLDIPRSWRDFVEGRSFTGAGQSLSISVQPGRERSQYSVEFIEPYLFGFPVVMGLEGSARDRLREDWLERRRAGRMSLGYRITPDLIFRTSYRIEAVRVTDIEPDAVQDVLDVRGDNLISGLRFSLAYNQNKFDRDFVLYDGYAISAYYEIVGQFLGGDHDFHRAGLEANWQTSFFSWPKHHKWVLAVRGELGWQRELQNEPIPIFERFFAGGPNSIRGFRFRSVGPKVQPGDKPLGGDFLLTTTVEFSFPLFRDLLRGVFFLDAGTVIERYLPGENPLEVDDTFRDFWEDEIRVSAGFGFRVKVPFFPAPVALDFGWPIREKDDDERQVFSFSVGFGF